MILAMNALNKFIRRLRHKPMWSFIASILFVFFFDLTYANTESEPTTTLEPDASPGCKAPEIRFNIIKPDSTTELPFAKFETTISSTAEDTVASTDDSVEKININILRKHNDLAYVSNSYKADPYEEHHTGLHGDYAAAIDEESDDVIETEGNPNKRLNQNRKINKKRRSGSGRRRRVENENGQSRGRGSRYKREIFQYDSSAHSETDKWNGKKLIAEGDVYYINIDEILKSSSIDPEFRLKLHKINKRSKNVENFEADKKKEKCKADIVKIQNHHTKKEFTDFVKESSYGQTDKSNEAKHSDSFQKHSLNFDSKYINVSELQNVEKFADVDNSIFNASKNNRTNNIFLREKRKSGKTTGALSRPKGGGDSSSKTTSRKDKGVFDEEGGYSPVHPDETDSEEEEEEIEEIDIQQQFTEVSEIRFPGEIGPLGDRRLCKIRCVKGKWVGPLCATNEEDENGNVKFQPLYKSCHVNRIPPYLLLSYRNISVNIGWDLPHGHSLQARCRDLGLYKLLGESRVLCSNGLWAPRMPSCVQTTLLTNFSDDSAPSIRYKIINGSGAFEPSGVLAVLPQSTIYLDCIYPRLKGTPEWTWTSWYMQYPTGWSSINDDKNLRYRLSIKDIQNSDSGTFTCTSPRGLTNSVAIVVATSTCPQLPEPVLPLTLRLEGNKLGQRAMYRCPPGYRVDGVINATCLASGNWSSPPPKCQAVQCPRLILDDSHLSLVELNTSVWGRAVFKCQWGFKLTGPSSLVCEPTGVWSGPVPRCRAIQCPIPLAPLNGRIGGTNLNQRRLTVGALVTFSCNEGHTLVGEPSIICTETGFWSHSEPFCKSQCLYPGDPPNGLIAPLKFKYDSGDYLSVQCRPGFVQYSEIGPIERPECQPDGHWSGPVPKCRSYEEV